MIKLTHAQVTDLKQRMEAVSAKEVEIDEAANGKIMYYIVETKIVRRPLKRVAATKQV